MHVPEPRTCQKELRVMLASGASGVNCSYLKTNREMEGLLFRHGTIMTDSRAQGSLSVVVGRVSDPADPALEFIHSSRWRRLREPAYNMPMRCIPCIELIL